MGAQEIQLPPRACVYKQIFCQTTKSRMICEIVVCLKRQFPEFVFLTVKKLCLELRGGIVVLADLLFVGAGFNTSSLFYASSSFKIVNADRGSVD